MRILEDYRGKRAVKAELQEQDGRGWKTLGTWSTIHLPFLFRRWEKVLINEPGGWSGERL
jgi:hypothetical protein